MESDKHRDKVSALVKLLEHIDKIKLDNINTTTKNELNRDSKAIFKELKKLKK